MAQDAVMVSAAAAKPATGIEKNSPRRFYELLAELAREHSAALQRATGELRTQNEELSLALQQARLEAMQASVCTDVEQEEKSRRPEKGSSTPPISEQDRYRRPQLAHMMATQSDHEFDRPRHASGAVTPRRRGNGIVWKKDGRNIQERTFLNAQERRNVRISIAQILQDYMPVSRTLSEVALDAEIARSQKLALTSDSHEIRNPPRHMAMQGRKHIKDPSETPRSRFGAFKDFISNPIHPEGAFMEIWRPMMFVAVAIAVTTAPFEITFDWWSPPKWYKVAGMGLDIFFILDMVLNFNLAYIHHGRLITSRRKIAQHYAETYLLFDILSNMPLDWFMGKEGKGRKFAKFLKLPKLLRMVKLLRTLKDLTQYVGVPLTFAALQLAAHYYACLWVFLELTGCEEPTCPRVEDAYFESFTMSLSALLGADARRRLEDPSETSLLLKLRPEGEPNVGAIEDMLVALMKTTGVALVACLFANVASALAAASFHARRRTEMLSQRMAEMRAADVPLPLVQKVRQTYDLMTRWGQTGRGGMLRDTSLSLDLRRNLAFHMYGGSLRRVPLLEAIPDRYLKCLAQRVQMRAYTPGDLLIMAGEVGQEVFIIHSGSVRPIDESGKPIRDVVLGEGCFFGEICFLDPSCRRTVSFQCVEFCNAMVLTIDAFSELSLKGLLDEIRQEAQKVVDGSDDDAEDSTS